MSAQPCSVCKAAVPVPPEFNALAEVKCADCRAPLSRATVAEVLAREWTEADVEVRDWDCGTADGDVCNTCQKLRGRMRACESVADSLGLRAEFDKARSVGR
jgi:hypothetical protein